MIHLCLQVLPQLIQKLLNSCGCHNQIAVIMCFPPCQFFNLVILVKLHMKNKDTFFYAPIFPQVEVPLKFIKNIIKLYLFFFIFLIVEQFQKEMIAIQSHSFIFCGFHIYLHNVYVEIKCYLELPLSCSLHCKRLFSWGHPHEEEMLSM